MISDYFNYDVDSLNHVIPDLELDSFTEQEWGLHKCNNPLFEVVDGVFTVDEISKIIFAGKQSSWNLGEVGSELGGTHVDPNIRKSKVSWLRMNQFNYWIYERLTEVINEVNSSSWEYDLNFLKTIQFSEYDSEYEGKYVNHVDSKYGNNMSTIDRKLSFSVQLSDTEDYFGGDLQLNNCSTVKAPRTKGSITIFPSHVLHEVTPVTEGVRYSLVGWVIGEKLK